MEAGVLVSPYALVSLAPYEHVSTQVFGPL
jgi:hypothetical protein